VFYNGLTGQKSLEQGIALEKIVSVIVSVLPKSSAAESSVSDGV
jgi:hypothetical protein